MYQDIDVFGIFIGLVSFIIALSYCYYLLQKFNVNSKPILLACLISAMGHFLGGYAFYEFSIHIGSDSLWYFKQARTHFDGFGYHFAFFLLGYLKQYIFGESFLAAFLFSGALGLIGSTYLFLTFIVLNNKLTRTSSNNFIDKKQFTIPAYILLCWPSYFFWTSGIIKDNFAFLSIMMILFVIGLGKLSFSSALSVIISSILAFMVRPYLFIIFTNSIIFYLLMGSKLNIFLKSFIILIFVGLFVELLPLLKVNANMVELDSNLISKIGEFAVRQQKYMAIGSSIPIPTHNPKFIFLFLPYLLLANLILPLGIGANNFIGWVSSFENAFLLCWIVFFFKNKTIWNQIKTNLRISQFYMVFFIIGMSCLGLMCTNLGLAMREKIMYVPAFLICICLTYGMRRRLITEIVCKNE